MNDLIKNYNEIVVNKIIIIWLIVMFCCFGSKKDINRDGKRGT